MDTDVQNLPPELGLYTARMLKAVEDQIVTLAEGTSECLQTAHNAANDLINDTRSGDRQDAVKIAGATALLLQSLAKLKGSYRHDYNIRRASEPPAMPRLKIGWSGRREDLLTQAEYDALNEFEKEDYRLWCAGEPPRFNGWRKKPLSEFVRRGELEGLWNEIRELSEDVDKLIVPSPLENHGSNNDAGNP